MLDSVTQNEVAELLPYLTSRERAELDKLLTVSKLWGPNAGVQTEAYFSPAEELFYGGAAGGGKSDLLIGLALTAHRKSIIFRREYPQLKDLALRSWELLSGSGAKYNGTEKIWRDIPGGRMLEFGAVQYEHDREKFKGRPHDLKAFDELPDFSENQYRFLTAWNRTTIPDQRCRVVAAGNPPTTADGDWVTRRWGPWLEEGHRNPALPGEIRWFATITENGHEREVERPDGKPFSFNGDEIVPRSRTFIPARIRDNPFLVATGYGAVLDALPEPLRSQFKYGLFNLAKTDNPMQVIPTSWLKAAQARWTTNRPADIPLSALGCDVARGGNDQTVIAERHGTWLAPLHKFPGSETLDGYAVAERIITVLNNRKAPTNIDVIGVGSSAYDILRGKKYPLAGINGTSKSDRRDKSGLLAMRNVRAAMYWGLREMLNPIDGDDIALPPDPELFADLAAPRWHMSLQGIQIEEKEEIIKRLGRSPDCGDAAVLAFYTGGFVDWAGLSDLGHVEDYESRWK